MRSSKLEQSETRHAPASRPEDTAGTHGVSLAGFSTAHAPDRAVLQACATYWQINSHLDGLLVGNHEPADVVGLGLHQRWVRALARVLSLPAETAEGERARSAVLRSAVAIVLGHDADAELDSSGLMKLLPRELFS